MKMLIKMIINKNMYNNENVSKNDDYKNCGRYKGNSISFRLEIKNY